MTRAATTKHQIARFATIFAGGTLLSRVAGLARDVVVLTFLPSAGRDAFLFAFRFPNLLRDMLGEGAVNAAFVPLFSACHEKKGETAFRDLVSACMSAMILVFGLLTLLGVLLIPRIPWAMGLLQPLTGKPLPGNLDEVVHLTQWVFPYLFFIGMAVFAMSPLFTVKHYATPSWSPVLLNLSLIASCLALHRYFDQPAWALVVGVWVGGILQLAVMFAAMKRHTGVLRPNFRLRHPGVSRAAWLLFPVILGQATGEVNKLVDGFFALGLGPDRVSALYTANRLIQLPLGVFGMAVAVAVLPEISRAAARDDHQALRETLMHGLRQSFFLVAPAMVGLAVLREPILKLLFGYGNFGPEALERSSVALLIGAFGLLSFAGVKVCVQGFYAVQNTKTPVIIASISMLINILLNCALVELLDYKGLMLATVLSFTLNFVLLYALLCVHNGPLWDGVFFSALGKMTLAAALMGAAAYGVLVFTGTLAPTDVLWARTLKTVLPVGAGAGVYALVSRRLHVEEWGQFTSILRRRKGG